MTEAAKKNLIEKLILNTTLFYTPLYGVENRKWFIKKIIDYILNKGTPDDQVEQITRVIIDKANVAVKKRETENKPSIADGLKNMWTAYDSRKSRIQIIYDLIAMYPEFVDTADPAYFDFIIGRRFRSIQRMMYFVNPNGKRNIFAYPNDDCLDFKLNTDASSYWYSLGQPPFFWSNKGEQNPLDSVESIFKVNKDCGRNILPCDLVATILHMDSLIQETKDKTKLFPYLLLEGHTYLKIDHPHEHFGFLKNGNYLLTETTTNLNAGNNVLVKVGIIGEILLRHIDVDLNEVTCNDNKFFTLNLSCAINQENQNEKILLIGANPYTKEIRINSVIKNYSPEAKIYLDNHPIYPPFHFLSDSRPDKALFEQKSIDLDDLQVGDHIYIRNHPLYGIVDPKGPWGGEHSFVLEIATRSIKEKQIEASFKVAGHGLSGTILELSMDMLNNLNFFMRILQDITIKHINNLKQINNHLNPVAGVQIIKKNIDGVDYNFFECDLPIQVRYKNIFTLDTGFVIKQRVNEDEEFEIYNFHSHDSNEVPSIIKKIKLQYVRDPFKPSTGYELGDWVVRYYNSQTSEFESNQLFEYDDKTPKVINFKDLKKAGLFGTMNIDKDVFVTRPRVDFSTSYQNFLIAKGVYEKTL